MKYKQFKGNSWKKVSEKELTFYGRVNLPFEFDHISTTKIFFMISKYGLVSIFKEVE